MLLLGIDLGTSSIKVSVVDSANCKCLASAHYPDEEVPIVSQKAGWAEQSPDTWWENVQRAVLRMHEHKAYDPKDIGAIGIAYQMHGLVLVDKSLATLRNSIIWCDSRAVHIGEEAYQALGEQYCLGSLLNSPGNFTASKLAWVRRNEASLYYKVYKAMLPGDFIAMKLTGDITTTVSALSEGIFWDFEQEALSTRLLQQFGIDSDLLPDIRPLFGSHGGVSKGVAQKLGLQPGIPVTYKAGDQPNNALSLNVLEPGEVAATAGTSGVIYSVTNKLACDKQSRVNPFAHVNHTAEHRRLGVLLCINGTGILNRWVRDGLARGQDYAFLNQEAKKVRPGSDGLAILPFGNGAERMLNNRIIGAHFKNINFNLHRPEHVFRATQEGIVYALRYGLDIMRENKMNPRIIRAGNANLFLSELFANIFVNTTNVPLELYEADGSIGAALGAGLGGGAFSNAKETFRNFKPMKVIEPTKETKVYETLYHEWKDLLLEEMA